MRKEKRGDFKKLRIALVVLVFLQIFTLIAFWTGITFYSLNRFNKNTYINGVNCSGLTIEEAKEEIETHKEKIIFRVLSADSNGEIFERTYRQTTDYFETKLKKPEELSTLLENQKSKMTLLDKVLIVPKLLKEILFSSSKVEEDFSIKFPVTVNVDKVGEYLKTIPELQATNMIKPENAYIVQTEDGLKIIPEKQGNLLDFEIALKYAVESIENGLTDIDFTSITTKLPEITSQDKDIVTNVNEINRYLSKSIKFEVSNGIEISLDAETMSSWIEEDERGFFKFNIEDNLPSFLDMLEEKIQNVDVYISIMVGDDEKNILVPSKFKPKLDREEEARAINEYILGEEQTYTVTPKYTLTGLSGTLQTYIALDITNQTVWVYEDGENILKADCVTGNVAGGHSTPTGIYFLTYKTKNATLKGYNNDGSRYASFVSFWMPFNGGIGFHDASWRHNQFGGNIYKTNGSHGCVNMRYDDAKILYDFINEKIPIIVF